MQVVLNLLNRETAPLIDDLAAAGVAVVVREALANGFLTGTVNRDTVFPPDNFNSRYPRQEIVERVEQVERLSFLLRRPVDSWPQAALRWVLDQPGVSSVLTGAKTEAEVRDGVAASDLSSFTADELKRAQDLHARDYAPA